MNQFDPNWLTVRRVSLFFSWFFGIVGLCIVIRATNGDEIKSAGITLFVTLLVITSIFAVRQCLKHFQHLRAQPQSLHSRTCGTMKRRWLFLGGFAAANLAAWFILSNRYEFHLGPQAILYRCNRLTGSVEFTRPGGEWTATKARPRAEEFLDSAKPWNEFYK